jgi:2-polyprenyl-6-methoxyphenol hydroxylase-like FAD-dependent oxidoreductase
LATELIDLKPLATWENVLWNEPVGIKCSSWVSDGVMLIGDAAHTMNPSLGQNFNLSLENGFVASEIIDIGLNTNNFSKDLLSRFERTRRSIVDVYFRESEYTPKLFATHNPILSWMGRRVLRKIASDPMLQKELLEFATGIRQTAPNLVTRARLLGLLP